MPKLIISYRRSDTQDVAGRIRDRLVEHFGAKAVYMDIDAIPPGVDFREHIHHALSEGDTLVALIGPKWLGTARGKRSRINDPDDPVRMEIEAALRKKLRIVPVLVNATVMPRADELPEPIKDLSYRNAVTVDTGRDFDQHIIRLIRALDYPSVLRTRRWVLLGSGATAAAVYGFLWVAYSSWWKSPGIGGVVFPPPGAPTDRSSVPPAGASLWVLDDGSKVYLATKGQEREFVFHEPAQQMKDLGARPGDLLFEGRRVNDIYEGRAWLYTGGCGTGERRAPYDATGPAIMPGNVAVELSGQVPVVDPATCRQKRTSDGKLLFETRTMILKFTERR